MNRLWTNRLAGLVFGSTTSLPLLVAETPAQTTAVVIDGDTVEQDGVMYRIHGIDAPDYGQMCGASPCGKLAVEAMADKVLGG